MRGHFGFRLPAKPSTAVAQPVRDHEQDAHVCEHARRRSVPPSPNSWLVWAGNLFVQTNKPPYGGAMARHTRSSPGTRFPELPLVISCAPCLLPMDDSSEFSHTQKNPGSH